MELKKQVVSLELAKKLKELRVKQESLFWYIKHGQTSDYVELVLGDPKKSDTVWMEGTEFYSAFTVAELISMLQEVAQEDIIVAWSDDNVADQLAKQLCTKMQSSKESVGSGRTQ